MFDTFLAALVEHLRLDRKFDELRVEVGTGNMYRKCSAELLAAQQQAKADAEAALAALIDARVAERLREGA
jgi:hypothetical protein